MAVRISHAWFIDHLIAAEDLPHGGLMPDCRCLGCGEALIAKIGNRWSKTPHFSHQEEGEHQPGEWRCNQRSLCTRLGGHHVRRRIRETLSGGRPLDVAWRCGDCGQIHRQNLLRGVDSVDKARSIEDGTLVRLFGPARDGQPPALEAVLAVGFMREKQIPEEARELARKEKAPLWLLSASSEGTAAELGDDQTGLLDAVATFQVPCYRTSPQPKVKPQAPQPTLQPLNLFPTLSPLPEPEKWPIRTKPSTPVPRHQGKPPTMPLTEDPPDCGGCPSCGDTLSTRFLYLHPFPSMSSKDGPVETMGLLLYHTNRWTVVGWEAMTELERETAQSWGANPKMNAMPSTLWNLATLINRDGCEVLGSYSCWCPVCKEVIETPF